jgi:hypothetical protein
MPGALASEARSWRGTAWRFVEAQHIVSTLKLVDTLAEQELLERLIEDTKPRIPPECAHLDYLLATPFRYGSYPAGSRLRPAGMSRGVFYCSLAPETAAAEIAFYRLLFLAESPQTPPPRNPAEFTAFSVALATPFALDLTKGSLAARSEEWTRPADYAPCQAIAGEAREAGIEIIFYQSVRDPERRLNLGVLECAAFERHAPVDRQTWRISFTSIGVSAICEHPRKSIGFTIGDFGEDPRLTKGKQV